MKRIAKWIAALAAAAVLAFGAGVALADDAVSVGGADIESGEKLFLGTWDGNPISWDVSGSSVVSTYILFNARIDSRPNPDIVADLTLETSELYTSTFPNFKNSAFSAGEKAVIGDFALSGDFGPSTWPNGDRDWYWINEPIYSNLDTTYHDWYAYLVNPYGDRDTTIAHGEYGVRPASTIDLTSVLFSSAAEGGKSGGAAAGGFSALSAASSVTAWKLTLKDSSRSAFTASAASGTTANVGYSSWKVPVTFSGANTGSGEYVSAILFDASGKAIYYGTVAASAASGTQDMSIPTGLAAGTYTLSVFSEQRNGAKMTDYASDFVSIPLTVEEVKHTLSITYVYDDGSPAADTYTAQVVEGAGYEVASPTIEHYTASQATVSGTMGGSDVEVTVTYALTKHALTVAYVYEEGGEAAPTYTAQVAETTDYSVDSPAVAHYTPDQATVSGTMGSADVDVTVTYSIIKHTLTVTYVYANGTGTAAATHTEDVGEGKDYSVDSPAVEGYTADPATVTGTMGEADVAVEVSYTGNPATISFDLAGGTLNGVTGTYTVDAHVGDVIKIPSGPTLKGYRFKYWSGSEYYPGDDYTVTGDHTLKAVYEEIIPPTGDGAALALAAALLVLAASGAGLALAFARKRG